MGYTTTSVDAGRSARLTPANVSDNQVALSLVERLPEEARFVLGDTHYNAPEVRAGCLGWGKYLVASGRGPYPHTDPGAEVRRIFHRLRYSSIENFYEHFKTIFEWPPSGANLRPIRHRALRAGAVFVYHLALLRRHEWNLDSNGGLNAFLRAA